MRRALIACSLFAFGSMFPWTIALAGDPTSALAKLIDNANYWAKRGRPDKAAEAWLKVLRSDPTHAEALAELGKFYAREGSATVARDYLERLRSAHPSDPRIGAVEQAVRLGPSFGRHLSEARALAKSGRKEEAVKSYRRAFGGEAPSGAVGLEFYQVLAGIESSWEEARIGLARLAKDSPQDLEVALAYAQHLTYREELRREGIFGLRALSTARPDVSSRAIAAWRAALLWLRPTPSDAELFDAYLSLRPEDAEIAKRRKDLRPLAPREESVGAGYEALKNSELDAAERIFRGAIRRGRREPGGLVGLAVVALQKEDFNKAKELLEEARALAPNSPEMWREPLETATFWGAVREGEKLTREKKYAEAEAALTEARTHGVADAYHADLALANLYFDRGRFGDAEKHLRMVLEAKSDHVEAHRALVDVLMKLGKGDEALDVNEALRGIDPNAAYTADHLRAESLRSDAELARREGMLDESLRLLLQARQLDPENEWVLLDLANANFELERNEDARRAVELLLALEPRLPAARLLDARLYAENGDYAQALASLKEIDDTHLAPEARALRRRLTVQLDVAAAVRKAELGKFLAAKHALDQLSQGVEDSPELMGIVALAWSDIGAHDRAVKIMDTAMVRNPAESAALKLQLASILLKAGREPELVALLNELNDEPKLTLRERRGLGELRVAHSVKRADELRSEREFTQAYAYLSPLLKEYPDNPKLMTALGRLFYGAGEPGEAKVVFLRVLKQDPSNLEAREGAVLACVAVQEREEAEKLVREGLAFGPDSSRMHLIAGRFEALVGNDGSALDTLRRAQALAEQGKGRSRGLDGSAASGRRAAITSDSTSHDILDDAHDFFIRRAGGSGRAGSDLSLQAEIKAEIERLLSRHSTELSPSFDFRRRGGERGLGNLNEYHLNLRAETPIGYSGNFWLEASPVFLDAGELDLASASVADRFGSVGASPPGMTLEKTQESANGVAFGVGLKYGGLSIWGGSTPLGFPRPTGVGGLDFRHRFGRTRLALSVSRRPVMDSLLAYAGARDPISDRRWGSVLAHGGRADFAYGDEDLIYYIFGGYQLLLGENVPSNTRVDAGIGIEWTLYRWDAMSFATGFLGSAMTYKRNLRYFTFGHGGYFSPQLFLHVGIPFRWSGRISRVDWQVEGQLGVNSLKESAADYYPGASDLQAAREQQIGSGGEPVVVEYPELSRVGFGIQGALSMSYAFSNQLESGLRVTVHGAQDYEEIIGNLFVRFDFQLRSQPSGARSEEPSEPVPVFAPTSDD